MCSCDFKNVPRAVEEFEKEVSEPKTHLCRSCYIFQPASHWSGRVLYLLRFPKRITRPYWTSGGQWHWFGASGLQVDYWTQYWDQSGQKLKGIWAVLVCSNACMMCVSDWNGAGACKMNTIVQWFNHMLWNLIWYIFIIKLICLGSSRSGCSFFFFKAATLHLSMIRPHTHIFDCNSHCNLGFWICIYKYLVLTPCERDTVVFFMAFCKTNHANVAI